MSKMTSQEMARIASLLDDLPAYHGIEGIHFGGLTVFDDQGEELGFIDFNDVIFVSSA